MHDLKQRRLRRGIGLRELARRLGVSPSALCLWERGRRNPTEEHMLAWRKALR